MLMKIFLGFFCIGCASGFLPARWQKFSAIIVGTYTGFRWIYAWDNILGNMIAWVVTFSAAGYFCGMLCVLVLKKLFGQGTDILPQYWTREDAKELERVTSFKEIGAIMLRVLTRIPEPVGMVIGPITTGGLGCVEKNMKVFAMHIAVLEREKKNIFNQLPFEPAIWRVRKLIAGENPTDLENEAVNAQLIQDIYFKLFESGKIAKLHRIHNWFSSFGARMEDEKAFQLGIEREDLGDD